ncbi:MAG: EAL domain-containing protein [Candidatus Thiodiazotropha sp. (ex Epidulcina cf. delphinae)]|nr:EAL domain-containing protein [Candidatus Thiodiazotropha sp. (ex Epidulcina cf. delphinae)]
MLWLLPLSLWTLLVVWSLTATTTSIPDHSSSVARESAVNIFRMVQLTRLWNARYGGVYVSVSDEVQPNPYLKTPNRDVVTDQGQRLTMINPAYMTRQIAELAKKDGEFFHITSLKPIRPANQPDRWEKRALEKFETGIREISERLTWKGEDVFRYMAPLITKMPCLRCHQAQGYELGDIRGGISITLPAESIFSGDAELIKQALIRHLVVYLLVLLLLIFFLEKTRRQWLKLEHIKNKQQATINERTAELTASNQQLMEENYERIKVEDRYRAVSQSAFDAIISADDNGAILSWNSGAERIFGYRYDEIIGGSIAKVMPYRYRSGHALAMQRMASGNDSAIIGSTMELAGLHKNGKEFPIELSLGSWTQDEQRFFSAVIRDITDRRKTEKSLNQALDKLRDKEIKLHHLAHHDPLTNLPNRLLFIDRLNQSIRKAKRAGTKLALLFIDLDRFKQINDSLGHPVGDGLLKAVASRLVKMIRENDTVSRLGGDEFTIILDAIRNSADAGLVAQNLIQAFETPVVVDGHQLYITVSVGISLCPQDSMIAEALIQNADTAMYRAKDEGRNTFQFYSEYMTLQAYDRVFLESDLRRSVKEGAFEIYFQPQFDLQDETLVGIEALLRWHRPEHGMVSPDTFIPVAEDTGLIIPIGDWVLRNACLQMKTWQDAGLVPETVKISVNLSVKQLQQPDLPERIFQVLTDAGLAPDTLDLEITESVIMQHPEKFAAIFQQLRSHGIELSIDDFGTGYSSLGYLKQLPINKLKIDRSFVCDIPDDANDEAIAKAIIALSKSMQLKVVAEGVETEVQADFLRSEGCQIGQGYLYSRPLPSKELEVYLQHSKKMPDTD